jgi:hypothetical protein
MTASRGIPLRMRNTCISGTLCTENQNTKFLSNNFFPQKTEPLRIKWKKINCTAEQTTYDNMAHALCMLDK